MLNKFYGVTLDRASKTVTVYSVCIVYGKPIVEKVAIKGKSVNGVGTTLERGNVMGISFNWGIQMYKRYHSKRLNEMSTERWGDGSNALVALFDEKSEAIKCMKTENLTLWDERFIISSVGKLCEIETKNCKQVRLDGLLKNLIFDGLAKAVQVS